jgi:nitroimidazol reductase NimA-like FMN-containing flavoprotein (pyridoxamine 5'-phosphate oxidase superfamily)
VSTQPSPSDRTALRRHSERGRYDRDTINAILDEALVCHLAFILDGQPHVIPTMYARVGDQVFVHGAVANRALEALRTASPACLEVTLLDGLVMARSAFNHSMNFRSVVVLGQTVEVTDPVEKLAAMRALIEHVAPGRWDETRHPNAKELESTVILALPLDEASAKVRTGAPIDYEADLALGFWAGVIPLDTRAGEPITDRGDEGPPVPPYARDYRRPSGAEGGSS